MGFLEFLVELLPFSKQLIQPYMEVMRRTGTGSLEARDFLWVRLVAPGTEIQHLRSPAFGTLLAPYQGRDGLRTEWRLLESITQSSTSLSV